jgi:hypothetical protein
MSCLHWALVPCSHVHVIVMSFLSGNYKPLAPSRRGARYFFSNGYIRPRLAVPTAANSSLLLQTGFGRRVLFVLHVLNRFDI